jgi:hypothetical protein
MNGVNRHIIQKQFLEVEMQDPPDAFVFRNKLGELYYERILTGLEIMFDEIGTKNKLIRKEFLEIDVGVIPSKNWEELFVDKVLRKMKESLILESGISYEKNEINKSTEEDVAKKNTLEKHNKNVEDIFFFFLQRGFFPWYVSANYDLRQALEVWMKQHPLSFKKSFLNILEKSERKIIQRLIYQFDNELLNKMLSLILEKKLWKQIRQYEKKIRLIEYIETEESFNLVAAIGQLSSVNLLPAKKVADKKNIPKKTEAIIESIYIQNAGLVILHPFLPLFFKAIGLTDEKNNFKDEASHQKAVLMSQYLVNGKVNISEETLVLNKIICGYPLEEPVIKEFQFSGLEINEARDLLAQIVQAWKMNGVPVNKTIEGLQESFLQRAGKLVQKDKDWILQVEQKPFDMVLASLPWSIGIIKNSWMEGILWVEWT